jgi:hypothetical protein
MESIRSLNQVLNPAIAAVFPFKTGSLQTDIASGSGLTGN